MRREPQLRVAVDPGEPLETYYNDLSIVALAHGAPAGARDALAALTADRERANFTSVAQLGLGAWQLRARDADWLAVTRAAADYVVAHTGEDGSLPYLFPLTHTYPLAPPWCSAMAQGEAASLLVRASAAFGESHYARAAAAVAAPLLAAGSPLVTPTAEGPVLQEYPTPTPSHVLNGWIFALWGLKDVAAGCSGTTPEAARAAEAAFVAGTRTLERRLPLYSVAPSWSRYDLFPHPIAHVASPFYHRLHIEQVAVMGVLHPSPVFDAIARSWEAGARSLVSTGLALSRKVAFRLIRPRGRRAVRRPGRPQAPG